MCRLLIVVGFGVMLSAAVSRMAGAAEPVLSFVKSPTTGKHIALQPRDDHHRVFALVRVEHGGGRDFEAELSCNSIDGQTVTESVNFTTLKDDQTFAICLRTPKKSQDAAQYTLAVKPRDSGTEDVSYAPLLYGWRIRRNNDGSAKLDILKAGSMGEIEYTVRKPVSRTEGRTIEWRLVPEQRVKVIQVPPGFVFGVDAGSQPILTSASAVN